MRLLIMDRICDDNPRPLDFEDADQTVAHVPTFLKLIIPDDSFCEGNQDLLESRLKMPKIEDRSLATLVELGSVGMAALLLVGVSVVVLGQGAAN
jgi:hypothetical protein